MSIKKNSLQNCLCRWVGCISILGIATSCNFLEGSPYDAHVTGETDINARNMTRIESRLEGKSSFKFAFISDTQRWYDETEAFVEHLNGREEIDFVLHSGDVSDFGVTEEFLWQRDILGKLKVPYVVLLGNHDVLGNGVMVYRRVFGTENFSFMAAFEHNWVNFSSKSELSLKQRTLSCERQYILKAGGTSYLPILMQKIQGLEVLQVISHTSSHRHSYNLPQRFWHAFSASNIILPFQPENVV